MNYDKSLAVKCINGTFVGKQTDELIIWKGIPYATQPVTTPQLGAIHACEIPYLFDTCLPDPMGSGEIVSTEDCEFRHVAKEMWTNFARTGNPSTDKYQWKMFSGNDRQTMVFDDAIGLQKDIFGRREDLMMSWAKRLGNGSSKRVC